jgi:hypothetical protein
MTDYAIDIGCDHGILSYLLHEKCHRVIGSDRSVSALKNAQQYLNHKINYNHIDLRLGNGLSVLKEYDHDVNTMIMAGMGIYTMNDILYPYAHELNQYLQQRNQFNFKPYCNEYIQSLLSITHYHQYPHITKLIIQPWPSYLMTMLIFIHNLLSSGWIIYQQHIDSHGKISRKSYSITTSFVKHPHMSHHNPPYVINYQHLPLVGILQLFPLYQKYSNDLKLNGIDRDEFIAWKQYLNVQRNDLKNRRLDSDHKDKFGAIEILDLYHHIERYIASMESQRT